MCIRDSSFGLEKLEALVGKQRQALDELGMVSLMAVLALGTLLADVYKRQVPLAALKLLINSIASATSWSEPSITILTAPSDPNIPPEPT